VPLACSRQLPRWRNQILWASSSSGLNKPFCRGESSPSVYQGCGLGWAAEGAPLMLVQRLRLRFFSTIAHLIEAIWKNLMSLSKRKSKKLLTSELRLNALPAEGLEPTRPCGHWILSPARLPIPPRRRGQEHTHFARRDEHFDWPGTQAASHCCTGTQSFSRYCLREKNLDTSQRSGRHFGMSGTRAKFNQAAARGCP